MSSATDIGGGQSWVPSEKHYLTPTLVVLCGSISEGDANHIKSCVERRLGIGYPLDTVRWFGAGTGDEVSKQKVTEVVTPLLRQELWEDLLLGGYVMEPPAEGLSLRVVAICGLHGVEDEIALLLKKLLAALRHALSGRAQLSPILVALGEGDLDPESVKGFWPRIRLETSTRGGAVVTRERLLQTCETVVVSLLNSEVVRTVDCILGPESRSHEWLWVGASAVSVDAGAMREYLGLLLLRELLGPMIWRELASRERGLVKGMIEEHADAYHQATLGKALSIASHFDWEHSLLDGDGQGAGIGAFTLKREGYLWEIACSRDGGLAGPLYEHLVHLGGALVENLAETVAEQHKRLLDLLALLLDRGAAADLAASDVRIREGEWPSGLAAVECAVHSAIVECKGRPDVYFGGEDVIPYQNLVDECLANVAEDVDAGRQGELTRYLRFERSIASPLGLALLLVPGWPLLAGIVARVLQWSDQRAAVAAAALVAAVGVAEFLWWRRETQKRLTVFQRELMNTVARVVLGVVAKVLRDYRLLIANRLQGTLREVQLVLDSLTELDRNAQIQVARMTKEFSTGHRDRGGIYTLAPLDRCREWKAQALREADAGQTRYKTFATGLAMEFIFGVIQRRCSPRLAVQGFEGAAKELTESSFRSDVLEAQQQAELEPALHGGRWWTWLSDRAQPLGATGKKSAASFTIMVLGGEAPTIGRSGEVSEHWRSDWVVARSRQPHEIVCLRGVVGAD